MGEAVTTIFRRLPLLLVLLAFPSKVTAHRLDEYLQATLVAIEPEGIRLEINLTPGVAVAERVLSLIDRSRDGTISTNESAAYAELVKRDLLVRLDGRNVELNLTALNFPESAEIRTGWGIIQMEFSGKPGALAAGPHRLVLENRHLPAVSVYLFNAAQPASAAIQIIEQQRNENQSNGEIAFNFHPPPHSATLGGILVSLGAFLVVLFAGVWQARKKLPAAFGRNSSRRRVTFPNSGAKIEGELNPLGEPKH
jgi:hypothetical protein